MPFKVCRLYFFFFFRFVCFVLGISATTTKLHKITIENGSQGLILLLEKHQIEFLERIINISFSFLSKFNSIDIYEVFELHPLL